MDCIGGKEGLGEFHISKTVDANLPDFKLFWEGNAVLLSINSTHNKKE